MSFRLFRYAETTYFFKALRTWRVQEAKRRGIPAFRIFGDRVLQDIVAKQPGTDADLLAISGLGASTVKRYGAEIFRLLQHGL